MSRHTLHERAAAELARHDLAGRRRAAGPARRALLSRWEPSRDGDSLSARPALGLRWQRSSAGFAA